MLAKPVPIGQYPVVGFNQSLDKGMTIAFMIHYKSKNPRFKIDFNFFYDFGWEDFGLILARRHSLEECLNVCAEYLLYLYE